jgi:mitogen-activated protein kinase 15
MSKEIESHILELFEVKTFLGSGAYGHVWRVTERSSGREYALKKIFDAFQNEVDAQRTYREISVLPQLDHDNVVRLHCVMRAKNSRDLYLLFESVETDLHSILGYLPAHSASTCWVPPTCGSWPTSWRRC